MQEPGNQQETPAQSQTSPFEPPHFSAPLNDFPATPGIPIPAPTGEMPGWQTGIASGANDSGRGPLSVLPQELQGVNWGAFLLNWIWSIAHNSWWGLLCFVPYVGFIMSFVLLFKGNEWAWQNRKWDSIEQFKETQAAWTKWGIIILVLFLFLGLGLGLLIGILGSNSPRY